MALPTEKFMKFPKYEEASTEQVLQAQSHIWNHLYSIINSMSLNCAVQLGIPDIIHSHGKPMTLSQLVVALGIDNTKSRFVHRLMHVLCHCKFFTILNIPCTGTEGEVEEEEFYWLTPASHFLLKDGPLTIAPYVQLVMDPTMKKPWDHMSEWLVTREQGSLFEEAYGRSFWEFCGQDSRFNDLFNQAMSSDAGLVMHILLKECKQVFEGIELIVDVGGGAGTAAKAILGTFPNMKCIVLDLPHVVAGLEGTENFTYIGGDMFQSIPPADAILLKWILHDWSDEESIKILEKCRQAISNQDKVGGKVIIIDMVLDDVSKENDPEEVQTKLYFDMKMMAYFNGKERSEKEWAELFYKAGFTSYKINRSLGMRSLIELNP